MRANHHNPTTLPTDLNNNTQTTNNLTSPIQVTHPMKSLSFTHLINQTNNVVTPAEKVLINQRSNICILQLRSMIDPFQDRIRCIDQ